jgi:hypothetical protein
VAQVVERLSSKCEALSPNPSTAKKEKRLLKALARLICTFFFFILKET